MTKRQKEDFIIHKYQELNKAAFCFDLSIHLEENGMGAMSHWSIYRNWFRLNMCNIPITKLNITYEFIKTYSGKVSLSESS